MSLINQMLKDLEERSAPQLAEHKDTITGITWTAAGKPNQKRSYVAATIFVSILCTGIAAGSYYHLNGDDKNERLNQSEAQQTTMKTEELVSQPDNKSSKNNTVSQQHEIASAQDSEARKMLAAVMASKAMVEEKKLPQNTKPTLVNKPVQLAAVEKPESKGVVQKKLLPLDNSKLAEIAYQQGYDLIAQGQQLKGERKLLHALELNSAHTKAREILAILYLQQLRVADATEHLQKGMALSPEHFQYREIYARALMAQNQLPQAIEMLNKDAPEINRYPNYHALIAGLYQKNEQHEQAASTYLKLIKQNQGQSQWWLGMAISLEKMEKNNEAISAYKKARELKLPAKLMKYVENRLQKLNLGHGKEK